MPKAELFKSSSKGQNWKARLLSINGKIPTDFNNDFNDQYVILMESLTNLGLGYFCSFLTKGVLPLIHVGLLNVTKSHMYAQRVIKNENDLGKLVQMLPLHLESLRSRVASV